jgi:tRNA-Thr(GGU) m(6)t(6)A37 methyltransferase TsaA
VDAIEMHPIGIVVGGRAQPDDDDWGAVEATIELDASRFPPDAVEGLDAFSHIDVVFVFHRVGPDDVHVGARHPRGRTDWPKVGIFAQRGKARPNRLGVTTCELVGVDGLRLRVRGLDAIDGTPVLDVKPHVVEFGPRGELREPDWMRELMAHYW